MPTKELFGRYLEDFRVGEVIEHWPGRTVTEADNAAQGDDEAKTRRRRGRKKADYATTQREAEIAANWKRAHEGGAYKPEWAKDNGMTEPELDAILDRVYKRKKRSDK